MLGLMEFWNTRMNKLLRSSDCAIIKACNYVSIYNNAKETLTEKNIYLEHLSIKYPLTRYINDRRTRIHKDIDDAWGHKCSE